jgi:hypothetical protein
VVGDHLGKAILSGGQSRWQLTDRANFGFWDSWGKWFPRSDRYWSQLTYRLKRWGHFLQEPEGLPAFCEALIPGLTDRREGRGHLFSPVRR